MKDNVIIECPHCGKPYIRPCEKGAHERCANYLHVMKQAAKPRPKKGKS